MNQDVKRCERCDHFFVAPCDSAIIDPVRAKFEQLGLTIDRLDNLANALQLPLPPALHVEQLKTSLPEVVTELKKAFVEIANENPWAG